MATLLNIGLNEAKALKINVFNEDCDFIDNQEMKCWESVACTTKARSVKGSIITRCAGHSCAAVVY